LGYMQGLGLDTLAAAALRILDKRDKIGVDGVKKELAEKLQLPSVTIDKAVQLAVIKGSDSKVIEQVRALGVQNDLLEEGLNELDYVLKSLGGFVGDRVVADLSIVRGFDYYTGTVYETKLNDYPEIGTFVAGGRYEDLASDYIAKKLPGVGISLGLSRFLSVMLKEGLLKPVRASRTDVLVTIFDDVQRMEALRTASEFRKRGINAEVYHAAQKFQKQMQYAEKKEIPYVWFLPADGKGHEVKNMTTREQVTADPNTWEPGEPGK